jgi:membrane protein implicated in regulation of membrane protease activity
LIDMSGFFDHLEFWHWLILAAVLTGVEMLTPGFAFIWLGGAALITALVVLVFPSLGWETQLILFAALSAISVIGWTRFGRRMHIATEDATLNRRGESLVGRSGTLTEAIVNGRGRVKIDDSIWRAEGSDAPAGTHVTVTGVQGAILKVERAGSPPFA